MHADKPAGFQPVFEALRGILEKCSTAFRVQRDTGDCYGLDAAVGPATLRAWRGKVRSPRIPVAWVQIEKGYVSYHLMGVYGNPKLLETCSSDLKKRMQGKSCFNFKTVDGALFLELERLTKVSLEGMKKDGYISTEHSDI
jgi:hypothetical protein